MTVEHRGINLLPVVTRIRERDQQRMQLELAGGMRAGMAFFSRKAMQAASVDSVPPSSHA